MKKIASFLFVAFLITSTAEADTIHLKNGSVLKGKVASFSDDQFVVMLDTGSGRYMSRAMIYTGDVARIEFDSAPAVSAETIPARESAAPPSSTTGDAQPRNTEPRETQPRETQPEPQPERNTEPVDRPSTIEKTSTATPASVEMSEPPRKMTGPVKTTVIDVVAKRDWTSTGLIIKRGDLIRITATGTVTLDPVSGASSGAEGTDLTDLKKLMADKPTGALIGVIGADNDDFIFVGRSVEFEARRDGLLFLSVNEGVLADNTGAYKATIELQSKR
ncbi:MAG TPA: hypothetical protein VJQ56_03265 [Blastocatellia bacterium]|nr:hypothetical protein [Blastocatellia bacterium]